MIPPPPENLIVPNWLQFTANLSRNSITYLESMKDAELEEASYKLDKIDENSDPLDVVISVLMLIEGFDRRKICIIVILRATETDLLLEQIVGKGLRLVFSKTEEIL